MLGDGETQAETLAGSRAIGLVEALKYAAQVRGVDARTGVGDREDDLFSLVDRPEPDRPAARREFHGVVHEVREHLFDAGGIGHDVRGTALLDEQRDAGACGQCAHASRAFLEQLRRSEAFALQRFGAALDAREREQLVHQLREAIDLAVHASHEVARRRWIVERALLQSLGHRLQRADRPPQLVRHVRDEVRTHRLEAPQRGEVLDHDEQLPLSERPRDDALEAARLAAIDDGDTLPSVPRSGDRLKRFVIADDFDEPPADGIGARHPARRGVREKDAAVGIGDEDGIGQLVDERCQAIAFGLGELPLFSNR